MAFDRQLDVDGTHDAVDELLVGVLTPDHSARAGRCHAAESEQIRSGVGGGIEDGAHPKWVYFGCMTKVIQIRDVPDDVHAELTRRAEAAGLSLSRFALRELELTSRVGRNAEIFARLRELPATGITDTEIIEDIRAARDRAG